MLEVSKIDQTRKVVAAAICATFFAYSPLGYSNDDIWATLKQGGNVIVLRHATTEKLNDNALTLKVGDCSVQRNLSEQGKKEALAIGQAFRTHDIPVDEVLSSRYCRTQDTAMLAFNKVTSWQPLDLLHAVSDQAKETRTETVTKRVTSYKGSKNIVIVSHRPNIAALTFEIVKSAEFLVLKPDHSGDYEIVGRLTVKAPLHNQ